MKHIKKFDFLNESLLGVDGYYKIISPLEYDELYKDYIDLEYDKWLKMHKLISWDTGKTNPEDYLPTAVRRILGDRYDQVKTLHGSPTSTMFKSRIAWNRKWKEDPLKGPMSFKIFEMDDDYYLVELLYDGFPLDGFGNYIYYKCDQWEGLMKFLKDFEMIKPKYR